MKLFLEIWHTVDIIVRWVLFIVFAISTFLMGVLVMASLGFDFEDFLNPKRNA